MPFRSCALCARPTIHYNGICTDHSDWPPMIKPRPITVVIPAFTPEVNAPLPQPMRHGYHRMGIKVVGDALDIELGLIPLLPRSTDGLLCSFCGVVVEKCHATLGKRRPRLSDRIDWIDDAAKSYGLALTRSRADEVVACPDHANHVHTTTFPEFD
jgi:hypothetical protein